MQFALSWTLLCWIFSSVEVLPEPLLFAFVIFYKIEFHVELSHLKFHVKSLLFVSMWKSTKGVKTPTSKFAGFSTPPEEKTFVYQSVYDQLRYYHVIPTALLSISSGQLN